MVNHFTTPWLMACLDVSFSVQKAFFDIGFVIPLLLVIITQQFLLRFEHDKHGQLETVEKENRSSQIF